MGQRQQYGLQLLKFQVMRYGNNENFKNDSNYFTDETTDIIDRFKTRRDLGVTLSGFETFNKNIKKVEKQN